MLTADLGTESARVGLFDGITGELVSTSSSPYTTTYPSPGHAEQDPADWWRCLCVAAKEALSAAPAGSADQIEALCIDTTACSVVALDELHMPLRKCLLWCDARSSSQCAEILKLGKGDPNLHVNSAGRGPISAEWMLPKALWIKQNEPETWSKAAHIAEKQDYVNFLLTGRLVASGCNTAARWHWRRGEPPLSLLALVGLSDLAEKWPREVVPMGALVGGLTDAAAEQLGGLRPGLSVIQGGPDAYVGMLGLGVSEPGKIALITGSSHLHLCVSSEPAFSTGFWGSYEDAPLEGICFSEGGQSSTGSLLQWAKRLLGGEVVVAGSAPAPSAVSFAVLDREAEQVPAGSDGLVALETFQGSRTPVTDPLARGAIAGLSLFHSRGHVWRSLLEAICLGTRLCLEGLTGAGFPATELRVGGGATRSAFFLQMHADVTGLPAVVTEQDNAPLLGCAVLAAAAAGMHDEPSQTQGQGLGQGQGVLTRVRRACANMVRVKHTVQPRAEVGPAYKKLFRTYKRLNAALVAVHHALASAGSAEFEFGETSEEEASASPPSAPASPAVAAAAAEAAAAEEEKAGVVIVPSLLSADFGSLSSEAALCDQGMAASWVHIDVCDGGDAAPGALTLGPQAVAAIVSASPRLKTDVHVVFDKPGLLIEPMARAGATRFTVQYEQLATEEVVAAGAVAFVVETFARRVRDAGMQCGIVLAPQTNVDVLVPLAPLLQEGLISFVDVLAVDPGFGGQTFNEDVLEKISFIRRAFPSLSHIGVDGGVTEANLKMAVQAGANFVIAGTAVYGRGRRAGSGDAEVIERLAALRRAAVAAVAEAAEGAQESQL